MKDITELMFVPKLRLLIVRLIIVCLVTMCVYVMISN